MGGALVDARGRHVALRGVNAVEKKAPFVPSARGPFDPERSLGADDAKLLTGWGFNLVRLGVLWQAHEPRRGRYNGTYLDAVEEVVDALWTHSGGRLRVVLDGHQDLLSPKFCGEGVPDWAAIPKPGTPAFPSPQPVHIPADPVTGYPDAVACQRAAGVAFSRWYLTHAAGSAWQNLYNDAALVTAFAEHWRRVATRFATHPAVIGYELLNEPWPGDVLKDPGLALRPGVADRTLLGPMYDAAARAIHAADPTALVLFQPSLTEATLGLPAGFEGPPGEASEKERGRSAMSGHVYCGSDPKGAPRPGPRTCKAADAALLSSLRRDAERAGAPLIVTELGGLRVDGPPPVEGGDGGSRGQGNRADEDGDGRVVLDALFGDIEARHGSWVWWQYKHFDDITTAVGATESLFDPATGAVKRPLLAALTRTFAPAVAVATDDNSATDANTAAISQSFDPSSGIYRLAFDAKAGGETEVYVHHGIHYPSGYQVEVIGAAATW